MGLSELSAFDAAYRVLEPLDAAGRRRALQWLSDALGESSPLGREDGAASSSGEPASPAPSGRRGRPARGGRAKAAAAVQSGKRGRRKADQESRGGERAYRRMPDADEVMSAYHQVGSISGLADRFDVPVYTVHGWARRLRSEGYQIGRGA